MSGIAAAFGFSGTRPVELMLERIRHRGPDSEETYINGSAQLGEISFYREDLEQVFQDGYGVVLDGTPLIDNAEITKMELLELYLERGPGFLEDLEGKFAFVISNGDFIFAARDLFGIKPLYYGSSGTDFFLASEMKALVSIGEGIEIDIFPPGHYTLDGKVFKRYKKYPQIAPRYNLPLEEAEKKLRKLILAAVKRALHTRGKKGIFLSGGVDSSIVAAAAKQVWEGEFLTYVAGLEGSPDIENARKMAGVIGSEHREYIYSPGEMFEILPEVIYYLESFDVELINSSIANYFVSRLAHTDYTRVILSGEGADELFGGYHFLKQHRDNKGVFNLELYKLMKGLHNSGFQRVDRMAKSHSLEVEMPFMDPGLVKFALQIPPHWKISGDEMGKWLLRKSFERDVPEEIIWRRKEQFGVGSGTENIMQELIEGRISDEEFTAANREEKVFNFKSKEEYYYFKLFKEFYPAESVIKTVNRWLV